MEYRKTRRRKCLTDKQMKLMDIGGMIAKSVMARKNMFFFICLCVNQIR